MNEPSTPAPEPAIKSTPRRFRWKRWVVVLALFAAAGIAFLMLRPAPELDSVMLLADGFPKPRRSFGILSRLPPSVQGLAYRIKYKLFGAPEAVNLNAFILHLELPPSLVCSMFSMTEPTFTSTNGLRVWLLSTNDLKDLGLRMGGFARESAGPRISTAHGVQASMSVTKSMSINGARIPVGLTVDCLPYARKHSLDLTTRMTLIQTISNQLHGTYTDVGIQTNSFGPLRIQIPDGQGVFMLNEGGSPQSSKAVGLSPSVSRKKK